MRHALRGRHLTFFTAVAAVIVSTIAGIAIARAQGAGAANGAASGLPVPRFVSLKSDKVNMHIGPAKTYEVKWLYQRAGLPVEITAEFENWRRIRDSEGTEGWVYHSLLSGRRTGVVTTKTKDELVALHDSANQKSDVVAELQPGVLATIKRCSGTWCRVSGQGFDGWFPQERLWGVYPSEKVD